MTKNVCLIWSIQIQCLRCVGTQGAGATVVLFGQRQIGRTPRQSFFMHKRRQISLAQIGKDLAMDLTWWLDSSSDFIVVCGFAACWHDFTVNTLPPPYHLNNPARYTRWWTSENALFRLLFMMSVMKHRNELQKATDNAIGGKKENKQAIIQKIHNVCEG